MNTFVHEACTNLLNSFRKSRRIERTLAAPRQKIAVDQKEASSYGIWSWISFDCAECQWFRVSQVECSVKKTLVSVLCTRCVLWFSFEPESHVAQLFISLFVWILLLCIAVSVDTTEF